MTLLNKLAKVIFSQKTMWIDIGNLETKLLRKKLKPPTSPIFICGLARSGTTILLEIIASHDKVATHTYRDFPMLYAPYCWNKALSFIDKFSKNNELQERSHNDGIKVSPKSPEAMEEILWMSFFKTLHSYDENNILDKNTKNPEFEEFYKEHIQKLLLAKNKDIYASKGNYNISRIDYISKIFPDAKIIIMVRSPVNHIYSSVKQDKLFLREQDKNPESLEHMGMSGHFEFGMNKAPINIGDSKAAEEIMDLFKNSKDINAWIKYWNILHQYIYDNYYNNPLVKIVRYEDMCKDSKSSLSEIFKFCTLDNYDSIIEEYSDKLVQPSYYKVDLTDDEIQKIETKTKKVASLFGY